MAGPQVKDLEKGNYLTFGKWLKREIRSKFEGIYHKIITYCGWCKTQYAPIILLAMLIGGTCIVLIWTITINLLHLLSGIGLISLASIIWIYRRLKAKYVSYLEDEARRSRSKQREQQRERDYYDYRRRGLQQKRSY